MNSKHRLYRTRPRTAGAFWGGVAVAIATSALLLLPAGALAAPANDNFSAAQPLELISENTYSGLSNNRGATKEPGEPNHAGDPGGASLWWYWTAPLSGTVDISSCLYTRTVVAAYTGTSVSALTLVGDGQISPTDGCSSNPLATAGFAVAAGTTYEIAVDGRGGAMGDVDVTLNFLPYDRKAPSSKILSVKVNSKRRKATVSFTALDNGGGNADELSFKCRLDNGPYRSCSTPQQVYQHLDSLQHTYKHLRRGRHTVQVQATDGAGNVEKAPATRSFKVKKT